MHRHSTDFPEQQGKPHSAVEIRLPCSVSAHVPGQCLLICNHTVSVLQRRCAKSKWEVKNFTWDPDAGVAL